MNLDDLKNDLLDAGKNADIELYRKDLIDSLQIEESSNVEDRDFAFVCEISSRLAEAEEFQDFIPCHYIGFGQRGKKLRVDGYEIDEVDDSIRLLIADFNPIDELQTITKTRAASIFSQLKSFIEESTSGRIWSSATGSVDQIHELTGLLENYHLVNKDGNRKVSRYKLYLITDSNLSEQLKELPTEYLDNIPIEFHIWDVSRLKSVSISPLGTEELEIDFTKLIKDGLPCLKAGQTDDYEGYLCVIPGDVLSDLYGQYGSKLLEGNVRSYLSSNVKVNKGIQGTIRKEPNRFFVYNNGISATASKAEVKDTPAGLRLISAKYLQIVNGGQTTASLNAAKTKDKANLSEIYIQMKLSVVKAQESDLLDEIIQNIARFSNTQTKVSDADFFSNHPFHRAIERRSRAIKAPAAEGAQYNTYWFYERARGQYNNEQSKMTLSQKKSFQRINPKPQLITKTDLAKYENSWRKLPHIVSRGAQKNFIAFAEFVEKEYGENGLKFDNEKYFKDIVSRTIVFKFIEKMVSQAKNTWYGGDYRSQIVTYTIAKLMYSIEENFLGYTFNFNSIWTKQSVTNIVAEQLEIIAKVVAAEITKPPVAQMNVGEWCKKNECWEKLKGINIPMIPKLKDELISVKEVVEKQQATDVDSKKEVALNAVIEVIKLTNFGCWPKLASWAQKYSPLYGKEADLVRNASKQSWIPSDSQAVLLMKTLKRLEAEGFSYTK